ncbi:hypothetical protein [Chryseobacterium candidae]|uniref:Uncharacterized protein n=1 Tax=Chryseobacterium candidae TaxID=1978493 RepID=A0ABY2R9N7_9FLAO|nr:hypothetical protein [Chryseobacterium candidae]THV60647.1 hypothetical protein EK417_08640 [Chryseobacterium candidae]
MKKKLKITSNLEQKNILKKAMQSSENVDLYKSIFGGKNTVVGVPNNCTVTAISGASAAYNRADQFLLATTKL